MIKTLNFIPRLPKLHLHTLLILNVSYTYWLLYVNIRCRFEEDEVAIATSLEFFLEYKNNFEWILAVYCSIIPIRTSLKWTLDPNILYKHTHKYFLRFGFIKLKFNVTCILLHHSFCIGQCILYLYIILESLWIIRYILLQLL